MQKVVVGRLPVCLSLYLQVDRTVPSGCSFGWVPLEGHVLSPVSLVACCGEKSKGNAVCIFPNVATSTLRRDNYDMMHQLFSPFCIGPEPSEVVCFLIT